MGCHRDEQALTLDGLGDPVEHAVQRQRQSADLIHARRLGEPTIEVTRTQGRGIVDQPIDRPKGASGQEPPAEQRHRPDGEADPNEQPCQRGLRVGDRLKVCPGHHDRAVRGRLRRYEVVAASSVEDATTGSDAPRCVRRGIHERAVSSEQCGEHPRCRLIRLLESRLAGVLERGEDPVRSGLERGL